MSVIEETYTSVSDRELDSLSSQTSVALNQNPVVIGIYGLPGSGKSYLLNQLKEVLDQQTFIFYEGSEMIATAVPGGLPAFQSMDKEGKHQYRQKAIEQIREDANEQGKTAIVAGHFMFWPDGMPEGQSAFTLKDFRIYTHILYLNFPVEVISQRRVDDRNRNRPNTSKSHLQKWQDAERKDLQRLCRIHGVLFMLLSLDMASSKRLATLIYDLRNQNEDTNQLKAIHEMDRLFAARTGMETMLVMDADKTLTKDDSGELFWELALQNSNSECYNPLREIFGSSLGYSYLAFRQVTLLYAEMIDDNQFESLCQEVASKIKMYPDFVCLLHLVIEKSHLGAVVITCGLQRIWEIVLERAGLSNVQVIGGSNNTDAVTVTPAIKKILVSHLQTENNVNIWAFGDSSLDLPMLSVADHAIVVVGDEDTRSRSMEAALEEAVNQGLRARQVVFPSSASPRLDTDKLPLTRLNHTEFIDDILSHRGLLPGLELLHVSTKNAGKLLMTQMRSATIAGPYLREAHRRVGTYLATEFLSDVIGVERYQIPHVQGHLTDGYRLLHESKTLIVALMRGGEPMAFGINDAFPEAAFLHAKYPSNVNAAHLDDQINVILVDSVINTGKTVSEFVQHIRGLHGTIRIVVVAGVVQSQCISSGYLSQSLTGHAKLSIVALRLSDNKYTGSGKTDTGNRLFNTVQLK